MKELPERDKIPKVNYLLSKSNPKIWLICGDAMNIVELLATHEALSRLLGDFIRSSQRFSVTIYSSEVKLSLIPPNTYGWLLAVTCPC